MRRVGWAIIALLGCGAAEEPQPDAEGGRRLEDFDPARYEIIAVEELEAAPIFVQKDGERIELASVVDGEIIVRERDRPTLGDAAPAAPIDDGGFSADVDPQSSGLSCQRHTKYEVPFEETIMFCTWTRAGWICSPYDTVVYHTINCIQSCSHPSQESCYDMDADESTTTPDGAYLVDQFNTACPGKVCGG